MAKKVRWFLISLQLSTENLIKLHLLSNSDLSVQCPVSPALITQADF